MMTDYLKSFNLTFSKLVQYNQNWQSQLTGGSLPFICVGDINIYSTVEDTTFTA